MKLQDAIQEGKKDYEFEPRLFQNESDAIKMAVARFIWKEFKNQDVPIEIIEILKKLTA